jgi:hypothetical protein
LRKILNIISVLVCIQWLIINNTSAQTIAEDYKIKTIESIQANNFEKAAYYADLHAFFEEDTLLKIDAYKTQIDLLKKINNLPEIRYKSENILPYCTSNEDKIYFIFQAALSTHLSNDFKTSLNYCYKLNSFSLDNEYIKHTVFLEILNLNALKRYDDAKIQLEQYAFETDKTIRIDSIFAKQPKLKSLKKARNLSTFMPSGGLWYNNDYGRATTNLLLNSASVGFIVYNLVNTNYITASTIGPFLFLYFYYGGLNQLNDRVLLKNQEHTDKYNKVLKSKIHEIIFN